MEMDRQNKVAPDTSFGSENRAENSTRGAEPVNAFTYDVTRAPALPRGAVRGCSYRGGSDFSRRRQILGQDTYLMGDCERSERPEPAAGGKSFEKDAFKVKID